MRVSVVAPLRDGLYAEGSRILQASGGKAHPVVQLAGIGSLRGRHNAQNAACSVAACLALGLDLPAIQKGLASFPGLAHRMQQIGRKDSVLFVNDSKATNVESAAQALGSFPDIFWIAGGKAKTGGIAALAEFFPRIRKAYLIGEAADEFAMTLDGKVAYEKSGVLSAAVDAAARDAAASGLKEAVVLAVAGLCFVRPVPEFRSAGKSLQRPGAGHSGHRPGSVLIALIRAPASLSNQLLIRGKPYSGRTSAPRRRHGDLQWFRARNARLSANGGGRSTG